MPNLPGLRDEREFSLGVYSPDLREPPAGKPRGHRLAYFPVCVFPCWRSAWLTRLCDRRNTGPPRGWRSRRLQQRRYPSSARHPAPQPGRRQEVLRSALPVLSQGNSGPHQPPVARRGRRAAVKIRRSAAGDPQRSGRRRAAYAQHRDRRGHRGGAIARRGAAATVSGATGEYFDQRLPGPFGGCLPEIDGTGADQLRDSVRALEQKVTAKRQEVDVFRSSNDIVSTERDENQLLSAAKGLATRPQ